MDFSPQRNMWIAVGAGVIILVLIIFGISRRQANAAQAAKKLISADTMHIQAELLVNLPERFHGQERPFTKTSARVEGDMKRSPDGTPELAGTLYLEARGRGNVFFAEGQERILRDRVLFNLETLPVFLNPSGSLVKRWTRVETPLLATRNPDHVREILLASIGNLPRAGFDTFDGEKLVRYSGTFSEEQEEQAAAVFRQSASGSPAWHSLARLLGANRVEALDVWVDASAKEIRRIRVHFVRPVRPAKGEPFDFDFATLTLTLTDYGKDVAIDVPKTNRSVKPEAFTRLFGGGAVEKIDVEKQP